MAYCSHDRSTLESNNVISSDVISVSKTVSNLAETENSRLRTFKLYPSIDHGTFFPISQFYTLTFYISPVKNDRIIFVRA